MKKKISVIAVGMLAAFGAQAGNDGWKFVERHAEVTQEYIAELQVCGERYGTPYSELAETLNEKWWALADAANVQFKNPDLHDRKIKVVYGIASLNPRGAEHERFCRESIKVLSEREIKSIDDDIATLKNLW